MDKMFAKPLISVLEGHIDSVNTMAVSRTRLVGKMVEITNE